ncbi:MIT domain-containing protein 1 isoform X1 [Petromyzon marinus]|uniref:MIT domain-containing protein 1 isoform X1 n=1 Tax=Petromyzon marinus TaxID=7757 RepID=UPI003F6F13D4
MADLRLAGMEAAAVSVLSRAVDLDRESRLPEALVCYQEGIQLLIDILKAIKEDAKKSHYRQKIEVYMERAEKIKQQVNIQKESGKYHEQLRIADNATGFSYVKLFGPYLDETVSEVWVEDPYIRHIHQSMDSCSHESFKSRLVYLVLKLYNLLRFCEMLIQGPCKVKKVNLLTSQDETGSNGLQEGALLELRQSLQGHNIALNISYSDTLHDREIRFNNGWIIKIGRGLDYFKKPAGRFSIGYADYDLRPCHETTVDIFHRKHTKEG